MAGPTQNGQIIQHRKGRSGQTGAPKVFFKALQGKSPIAAKKLGEPEPDKKPASCGLAVKEAKGQSMPKGTTSDRANQEKPGGEERDTKKSAMKATAPRCPQCRRQADDR